MTMVFRLAAVLALTLSLVGCASVQPGSNAIATETFMIPALDPGIQLHVRNKHPQKYAGNRIALFVHGATFSSEVGFDIDLPGGSWMDFAASRGFDVYALDVRGYGRSTRPPAMGLPPDASPPFADTREALRYVSAAIDFILRRRGAQQLDLIGWSWGTTLVAGYAAQNPEKVSHLVLYGPVWTLPKSPPYQGAYRSSTREGVRAFSTAGIPPERVEEISPAAWYDKWWAANLATDPLGASRTPPMLRSPNGVMKDLAEFWVAGKPTYDPAAIRAPTLLAVGEWDVITPPPLALELFKRLTGAKHRRVNILSEGSHFMATEKNRMQLIGEVQHFLEEPAP